MKQKCLNLSLQIIRLIFTGSSYDFKVISKLYFIILIPIIVQLNITGDNIFINLMYNLIGFKLHY